MSLRSRHLRFLDSEEDVNTYCLPGDSNSKVEFNCFGFSDNLDENSEVTLDNFRSYYVSDIPKDFVLEGEPKASDTKEPNNGDAGSYRYTTKSKNSGLSGGAIAGIIIACVAVLAIVGALAIIFRKRSNNPNIIENSDTIGNLKAHPSINNY